jgi:spore coat protein CotH
MTSLRSLLIVACFLAPGVAAAQTADDLFNPDAIHRFDLLVNSRDWEKLKADFLLNEYYPADIRWNGLTVRNVGIRSRGFSSRSGVKPALRVDMNRYTTGQQFLGLKSLMLDNLVTDPTGVKELVAMRLHARMGLPAPREAHVALYVNNIYMGLYGLVEPVDKDLLARVFGERTPGDTENDGHLFEYTFQVPWRWEYLGPELEAYAAYFNPKTHEQAPMTELYAPIEEMVRAVNEAPDFVEAVSPFLDLPVLMRQLAVQNFLAENDGILGFNGTANFFLYRFEESTRSQFIPWDEDRAFHATDWPIFQFHDVYGLMQRAMGVPALRTAYLDALLEVTAVAMEPATEDPLGPGWLEQEINTRRAQIAGLMHADPLKPYSNEEFEAAMDAVAAFPVPRAAYVRGVVAKER